MGYMADESALDAEPAQAVFYCAKYMTKDVDDMPRGTRRIVASRNFPDRDRDVEKGDWSVLGDSIDEWDAWQLAWKDGMDLYDLQEERKLTSDDFLES
jgi:hypothetical protein